MYLLDILPLTRIPHTLPQILSYFHGAKLNPGALVQIPLGRRHEEGIVIGTRSLAGHKMEIKSANFELRNISKIISAEPVLTKQQLELALFLGQYYFCSPGIFAKMALPPKNISSRHPEQSEGSRTNARPRPQKFILAPTVSQAYLTHKSYPSHSVIWHSELTQKQKTAARLAVKTGTAKTIIGTRSAVFLPFANLKKIIIEDAASSSHKSWDMFPHYDGRVIAQKLAKIFKARLLLRTPPWRGETIPRLTEKTRDRHGDSRSESPRDDQTYIVDMRQELKDGNFSIFSIALYEAVKKALADKQQIILFINRRGAANFILCRDCGYVAKCQNCDAPLAYHTINNKPSLLCHHCGSKDAPPGTCPKCHSWKIKTMGSGSQKVETETHNFFPDAKIARLDSDSAPKPKDQQKIIADFVDHKADILIATPMIFSWLKELAAAKPAIVGILSADTLLHIPDFRSGERTWQTIKALQSVVASAAPLKRRGAKQSRNITAVHGIAALPTVARDDKFFFIQTYNPANSVLKYLKNNDYADFAKEDMETREALNYPPFSQIVKLTFRHRDAKQAGQEAKILAVKLNNALSSSSVIPAPYQVRGKTPAGIHPAVAGRVKPGMTNNKSADNIEISPALPAFLPRERGKYVWNIILKFLPPTVPSFEKGGLGRIFTSPEFLQKRNSLLQYVPSNWEIDVDPENLL